MAVTNESPVSLVTVPGEILRQNVADYDTGAGTVNQQLVGIALPGAGGPVAGGTAANPVAVTTNGASPQPPARIALTNTSEQTLVAAPGVGLSIYVTDMTGSNSGGQRTLVDLKEGAAGITRYSYLMAANGGGFAHSLRSEWKLPANTALIVQQSVAVDSYVTVNYFIAA